MTKQADNEHAVHDKIAALPAFVGVATRLHQVITAANPQLQPRLWYGMPGYARTTTSPVLCFFRVDGDDYLTLGLTEKATHSPDPDSGNRLMPSAWFLTELDEPTEADISRIIQAATGDNPQEP